MSFGKFVPKNAYAYLASSPQQASRPQMGPAAPITQMGPPAPIRGQSAMQKALSELDLSQLDSDKAAREDLLQQKQEERQAFLKQQKQDRTKDILFAIGGALQGDKQFVEKTLQLREMREGKRKQQKQDKVWKETLEKAKKEGTVPNTLINLMEAMPSKDAIPLFTKLIEPKEKTTAKMRAELATKVSRGEKLTKEDLDTLIVIDPGFGDLLYTNPELFEAGTANETVQDNESANNELTEDELVEKYLRR